jgi:hypothetical protein
MSGYSFGAVTTQAVSGQISPVGVAKYTDSRIKAALVLSPSPPKRGNSPEEAFGKVSIPWMLMTGTEDNSPLAGGASAEERQQVYQALPRGNKYELVLDGANMVYLTIINLSMKRNQTPIIIELF